MQDVQGGLRRAIALVFGPACLSEPFWAQKSVTVADTELCVLSSFLAGCRVSKTASAEACAYRLGSEERVVAQPMALLCCLGVLVSGQAAAGGMPCVVQLALFQC